MKGPLPSKEPSLSSGCLPLDLPAPVSLIVSRYIIVPRPFPLGRNGMRLKKTFITQESGERQILVSADTRAFSGIVQSNRTAAFLVNLLKENRNPEELVKRYMEEYGVTESIAGKDLEYVTGTLRRIGALDE